MKYRRRTYSSLVACKNAVSLKNLLSEINKNTFENVSVSILSGNQIQEKLGSNPL